MVVREEFRQRVSQHGRAAEEALVGALLAHAPDPSPRGRTQTGGARWKLDADVVEGSPVLVGELGAGL